MSSDILHKTLSQVIARRPSLEALAPKAIYPAVHDVQRRKGIRITPRPVQTEWWII